MYMPTRSLIMVTTATCRRREAAAKQQRKEERRRMRRLQHERYVCAADCMYVWGARLHIPMHMPSACIPKHMHACPQVAGWWRQARP